MTERDYSDWKRGDPIGYIREKAPDFGLPGYDGERYEALVPDTLDLQERAALAVNGLTGPTDPLADHEIYWQVFLRCTPPMMRHDWNDHVQVKFLQALPLVRLASGSDASSEVELRWLETFLKMQGPGGLFYYPRVGRPWATIGAGDYGTLPEGEHLSDPQMNGWLLGVMAIYYQLTGDSVWKEAAENAVEGLRRVAVERESDAYFPRLHIFPGQVAEPVAPEPRLLRTPQSVLRTIQGLVQYHRTMDHVPALALARGLVRYALDSSGLFHDDGRWGGYLHFHGHTAMLQGILEYAMVTGDADLVEFVRKAYEWGKTHGEETVGYFPEHLSEWSKAHGDETVGHFPEPLTRVYETSEICEVADMIALGLKLTEAGAGDHWDEVDRWVRNMLVEGQLTPSGADWLSRYSAGQPVSVLKPTHQTADRVLERNVGAFAGWPAMNDFYVGQGSGFMHCCTGNGARAIYYVWENILTYAGGKLSVNLLLNRASAWADVDSHIPYTGRVDVRIKQPVDLSIRIPEWVQPSQVTVQVDGVHRAVDWDGRYAVVGEVKPGEVATMTVPIAERTDTVWVEKKKYTLVRKGNDVVAIDPPGRYCPLYQREHYRQDSTRWRKLERFVPDRQLHW